MFNITSYSDIIKTINRIQIIKVSDKHSVFLKYMICDSLRYYLNKNDIISEEHFLLGEKGSFIQYKIEGQDKVREYFFKKYTLIPISTLIYDSSGDAYIHSELPKSIAIEKTLPLKPKLPKLIETIVNIQKKIIYKNVENDEIIPFDGERCKDIK